MGFTLRYKMTKEETLKEFLLVAFDVKYIPTLNDDDTNKALKECGIKTIKF